MQIRDSSLNHFRRGHRLVDGSSSRLQDDGIKLHGLIGRRLFLRVITVDVGSTIVLFQFVGTFALQQRARVIDIALYVALIAFDAHFIRVDLGLCLGLLLLPVL